MAFGKNQDGLLKIAMIHPTDDLIEMCCTDGKPFGKTCFGDESGKSCSTKTDLQEACKLNCAEALNAPLMKMKKIINHTHY